MRILKKAVSALLCLVMLMAFASCNKAKDKVNDTDFNIVTSFYPMYIFTLNLIDGVDGVSLSCMAKQNTGCLHNYQLSTEDMKSLSKADLFIINGGGMEPFIDDISSQISDLKIVSASDNTNLITDDKSYEPNAHVWMSPENAKIQIHNIANALKNSLPASKDIISENEAQYINAIDVLMNKEAEIKTKANGIHVVLLHEAFSYLASDLGFIVDATIETDSEAEPSTQQIAEIVNIMKENNTSIILVPPEYSGNADKILASETGAKEVIIDPITTGDFDMFAYENLFNSNLDLISEAVN